jgi:predicted MFS family arabinose efflux permease
MVTSTQSGPATFAAVFGVRDYRALFGVEVLSKLGLAVQIFALSVVVFSRTGSPLLSAAVFAAGFLPQLVGGVLLGPLSDHLPVRSTVAVFHLVLALSTAAIAILALPVWAILALLFVTSVFFPVGEAAINATLPEVLSGGTYVLGQSVFRMVASGMQITGYALGGLLLAVLTPKPALLVSAGTFAMAAFVCRFGLEAHTARARNLKWRGFIRSSMAGNVSLLRDSEIRGLLLANWIPPICITGSVSLLVPYVHQIDSGSGSAGILLAALPCGMLVGDLVVGRVLNTRTRNLMAFWLAVTTAVPFCAFVFRPDVPVALLLITIAGAGASYLLPLQPAFVAAVPDDSRGQAFALRFAGLMGGQGIGTVLAGGLAEAVGPATTIGAAGAVAFASILMLRPALTSDLRRYVSSDEPGKASDSTP